MLETDKNQAPRKTNIVTGINVCQHIVIKSVNLYLGTTPRTIITKLIINNVLIIKKNVW
jgi:adenylate kinase